MPEPGKFAPGLVGFPTPNNPSDVAAYLMFYFPDETWAQWILGALEPMVTGYNWYESGEMTVDEAAEAFRLIIQQAPYNLVPSDAPTPFWDDESDVEDSEPVGMQPWYGQVSNPEAPAGELDFVESVALWFFTGIVALATFEVGGLAPAVLFHTTVEKFIILQKRGDAAQTIRYVIDGQDAKFVNTAPYSPGDIISTPLVTPVTGGDHTLMMIQTS
jgi:hypothetical protein